MTFNNIDLDAARLEARFREMRDTGKWNGPPRTEEGDEALEVALTVIRDILLPVVGSPSRVRASFNWVGHPHYPRSIRLGAANLDEAVLNDIGGLSLRPGWDSQ